MTKAKYEIYSVVSKKTVLLALSKYEAERLCELMKGCAIRKI